MTDDERIRRVVAVERIRAVDDPLVFPERSNGYGAMVPDELKQKVIEGRLALCASAPDGEPVDRVPWAEVVAYCLAGTGNAALAMTDEFVGIYTYAFRQYLEVAYDGESMMPDTFLEDSDRFIDDDIVERAEQLRREIKATRDKHFVAGAYDSMPIDTAAIPKATWKHD